MAKYRDKTKVGRSTLVPFDPDESWKERHERRKSEAENRLQFVRNWCSEHGIRIVVSNDGHHWRLHAGREVAEWWPSTGKLVFNRQYKSGIHLHDVSQLTTQLAKQWFGGSE